MSTAQSAPRPVVTSAEMRRRIAELGHVGTLPTIPASFAVSDDRWRLRERVVLVDYFVASMLAVNGTVNQRQTIGAFVTEDCELVTTQSDVAWRLRLPVRQATIGRLGVQGLREVISRADSARRGMLDVSNTMACALLEGPVDLSRLSPDELSGVLQAREWLDVLDLQMPAVEEIRHALDFANVLVPLRSVARDDFVGRTDLLAMLEAFIDSDASPNGPMAIHGPGGVGKSALVAKFVLDRVTGHKKELLFAYLTFDRTELNPEFPLTLFREAARQVALQVPAVADQAAALIREFDQQLAADIALRNELSVLRGYKGVDTMRGLSDLFYFLSRFALLVRAANGEAPIALLLDTFEIAQRRHASSLGILESALRRLQELLPTVRIIVTGRAEAPQITSKQMPLQGLERGDAKQLLQRALRDFEVPDSLLEDILDRVTGNPLSLRLAAELVNRTGTAILSSDGRRRFLRDLEDERIQGVLYRRILDHIDFSVRPLANPGLAVRRITPDLIAHVLAVPCGLGVVSPARAQSLFETLRKEVSLVNEVRPGVLIHRSDVREQMLPLLAADDAKRVKSIHRLAVKYYVQRPGQDEREEELYHRLMLGQSTKTLDKHWNELAGRNLEVVLPELPASSRVYVASKLSLEVSPADLATADRETWVRQVTRQGRRLLDSGLPDAVLGIIQNSPVHGAIHEASVSALLAEALALLGRSAEALGVAQAAIGEADREGRLKDHVELSIVAGRVAEDDHDFGRAYKDYLEAYEIASDFSVVTSALAAGAGVLRVARRMGDREDFVQQRIREAMITAASALTAKDKSHNPGLLRELAAELGRDVPQLLSDAATYLGVETLSKAEGTLNHHVRDRLDNAVEAYVDRDAIEDIETSAAESAGKNPGTPLYSARRGKAIADALNDGEDEDLRASVAEYFQSESDDSSYG